MLHAKAAKLLPHVGLARSKQDPGNYVYDQYLYHPRQLGQLCNLSELAVYGSFKIPIARCDTLQMYVPGEQRHPIGSSCPEPQSTYQGKKIS